MNKQLISELGNPHYVLSAPVWILHLFRVMIWISTLTFFFITLPSLRQADEQGWPLWLLGGGLLLLSMVLTLPVSFQPLINFACDARGVYLFYNLKNYAFIPWRDIRDIKADTLIGDFTQRGLLIEARVEDPALQNVLFRQHILASNDPIDEEGYGHIGIAHNAGDMDKVLAEINQIRHLSGSEP